MTHAHLPPTFALDRAALSVAHADPCALARAVEQVGADFPAVGAVLFSSWVAS